MTDSADLLELLLELAGAGEAFDGPCCPVCRAMGFDGVSGPVHVRHGQGCRLGRWIGKVSKIVQEQKATAGANDMVEVGGLVFRNVRDGDQAPFDFHTQAPELLRWFCPSLSMAEAAALVRRGNGLSVTAENLRRLVVDNIEAVRAALPQPAEVAAVLRSVEWCGPALSCPDCGAVGPTVGEDVHAPGCALAAMIERCEA